MRIDPWQEYLDRRSALRDLSQSQRRARGILTEEEEYDEFSRVFKRATRCSKPRSLRATLEDLERMMTHSRPIFYTTECAFAEIVNFLRDGG